MSLASHKMVSNLEHLPICIYHPIPMEHPSSNMPPNLFPFWYRAYPMHCNTWLDAIHSLCVACVFGRCWGHTWSDSRKKLFFMLSNRNKFRSTFFFCG
jgi:hypothetical protein